MTGEAKKFICCCSAGSWTKFLAWAHIVYCGLGSALFSFFLWFVINRYQPKDGEEPRGEAIAEVACTLIYLAWGLIWSIFHLRATAKKQVGHLWWWFGFTLLALVAFFIGMISDLTDKRAYHYHQEVTAGGILKMLLDVFTLLAVYLRIQEIKAAAAAVVHHSLTDDCEA